MLIDITFRLTPQILIESRQDEKITAAGHIGTHFDSMNREFPLAYIRRKGIVFDVSAVRDRDIDVGDIPLAEVKSDMFIAFCTGFIEEAGYGTKTYFADHPQLSHELIDALLERGVSIIAVDCAGIRRGKEHIPKDQQCADRGTFVVENLCTLKTLAEHDGRFTAYTFPMNVTGVTGIPCRVVAEI